MSNSNGPSTSSGGCDSNIGILACPFSCHGGCVSEQGLIRLFDSFEL
jgi:hypothetical protein